MSKLGLARLEALMEALKREIEWSIPDGTAFGGCVKHVKIKNETCVVASADSVVSWSQPAGTVLNAIYLAFPVAPVLATTGDIGIEVGTSSGGAEIVDGGADEALDGGTTITAGAVIHVAQRGKAADGSGGPIHTAFNSATTDATSLAADGTYTAAARTLYFNTPASVGVTTAGTCTWIVEYMHIDAGDTEGSA